MSATSEPSRSASTGNKPLWAAVGVLGVAVLAMGATLIHIQTRPEEPSLAVLATVAPAPTPAVSATPAPLPAAVPTLPVDGGKVVTPKKASAPANNSSTANKSVTNKTGNPVQTPATVNRPAAQVPKSICVSCGTVESVTPIQRDGAGSGVGAVAGGVLGAVVGNQVGGGDGKKIATVLGAVGGGFAGNAVEKNMKKETVYQVQVRMEDGSTRTVEQTTPASVGAKVIVEGGTLQPASR